MSYTARQLLEQTDIITENLLAQVDGRPLIAALAAARALADHLYELSIQERLKGDGSIKNVMVNVTSAATGKLETRLEPEAAKDQAEPT